MFKLIMRFITGGCLRQTEKRSLLAVFSEMVLREENIPMFFAANVISAGRARKLMTVKLDVIISSF